jgi:predicted nucleotidyltransferase
VYNPLFSIGSERRDQIVQMLSDRLSTDPDVAFAYLHGSFAREEPFHDIDVAVYFETAASDSTGRFLALADVLSRASGYPVDLRALNDASLPFQFRSAQGTLLACRDEERLAHFLERTGRRYADLAPRLRQAARDAYAR